MPPTRRDFLKTTGAGAIAAAATLNPGTPAFAQAAPRPPLKPKRRYAIVGTGVRGLGMWGRPLLSGYGEAVEFVGLCDINAKRVELARESLKVSCPTFTDFDRMCDTVKPELLTVTTVDAFHAEYIVRALDRGIDVLTEKPMVVNEAQCQQVLDAERRNKRKIIVAFNYRFAPKHVKIKELLQSGAIGQVTGVDFHWYLDTTHGADYFRRWHRLKSKGGSLWVHKATHHFDLINWWLDADPVEVQAYGDLAHYGRKGPFRSTNCRPCPHKTNCQFYWDITRGRAMQLYTAAESEDGYLRDGCVFKEDIDIWDTMSATVKYSNGTLMSYSLNTFMPIEGYALAFNGTKGRLEVRDYERQPWPVGEETEIYLIRNFGQREKVEIPKAEGGHGGGDTRLHDLVFRQMDVPDYLKLPDSRAGALSCLTGIAARKSIEEKRAVKVADLVRLSNAGSAL
jgi:predicted dehydrogenase